MKKITNILLFAGCLMVICFNTKATAQELTAPRMGFYQEELFINPAFAGSQGLLSADLGFRKQWTGINGSPFMQSLQADMPFFNNKAGLGLTLENMSTAVRNQFSFRGIYAYRIALKTGTLSMGLSLGATTLSDNYTDLNTPDIDPVFSENTGQLWGFNFGFGVYYTTDRYYVGLSIPSFMDNTLKEGEDKLTNNLRGDHFPFYLVGGYVFPVSATFSLKPATVLYYSGENEFRYNVNVSAFMMDNYWAGVGIRSDKQLDFMAGLHFLDYITVGYILSTNFGSDYSGRGLTHQITLGFTWSKDKTHSKLKKF